MCLRGIGATKLRVALVALLLAMATLVGQVPAYAAAPYVTIAGSGSTWVQGIIEQWRAAVATSDDMTVYYAGVSSTHGRRDFIQGTTDYAVS